MGLRLPTEAAWDASALVQALVDELRGKGCLNAPQVEAAFRAVPRHHFLPDMPLKQVYTDRAIPTKQVDGVLVSSSSQPTMMAIMLEQLGLAPGHNVLEIGAGTGYNAALLAHLVGTTGRVSTVDIDAELVAAARDHLAAAGCDQVLVVCADGGFGYPDAAPYDRIILTVGAAGIAPAWWAQLKPGGRLVLPLVIGSGQKSVAFERAGERLESLSVVDCRFMTLRGVFAAPPPSCVQLGPDPDLDLEFIGEQPVDAEVVYAWLTGFSQDWATGVAVTLREIVHGLVLWLELHEPAVGTLRATGDMVDRGIVPPLVGIGGEWKSASTGVLLGDAGLAALVRPPGQPLPLPEINAPCAVDEPFMLYVRQFGSDGSPAQRFVEQVRAWEAAGRPSSAQLRIRAYPEDTSLTPSEEAFVVQQPGVQLVLEWR